MNKTPDIDKKQLSELIQKFKALEMPDHKLTQKILQMLGIYDIVELEFTMNSYHDGERLAAMKMIEKYLDQLTSEDHEMWKSGKKELAEIYYQVASSDEEALL